MTGTFICFLFFIFPDEFQQYRIEFVSLLECDMVWMCTDANMSNMLTHISSMHDDTIELSIEPLELDRLTQTCITDRESTSVFLISCLCITRVTMCISERDERLDHRLLTDRIAPMYHESTPTL